MTPWAGAQRRLGNGLRRHARLVEPRSGSVGSGRSRCSRQGAWAQRCLGEGIGGRHVVPCVEPSRRGLREPWLIPCECPWPRREAGTVVQCSQPWEDYAQGAWELCSRLMLLIC